MGESAPSGEGCGAGLTRDSPQESGVWSWAPPTFLEVGGHSPRRLRRLVEAPPPHHSASSTADQHGPRAAEGRSSFSPAPTWLPAPGYQLPSQASAQTPHPCGQPWPVPAASLRSMPIHSALANPSQQHSQRPRLCPPPPPLGATTSSPQFPLGLQSLSSITLPSAHSLTYPQCPSLLRSKTPGPAPIPPALPDLTPVDLSHELSSCPPPPLCLHQPGPGPALLKSTTLTPSGLCPLCFHCLLLQLS